MTCCIFPYTILIASFLQRAYLTLEQCDAVVSLLRQGDAAALGLWAAFESRNFADFLSFLQPLQVKAAQPRVLNSAAVMNVASMTCD
jgi:hypothetical protein